MMKMCCEDMFNNVLCTDLEGGCISQYPEDKLIYYSSKFNEYGLPVHDGENGRATSYVLIQHCPWCGKKLPESRREEWFDRLESLGFDSPFDDRDNIPAKFKTSEWYSGK